MAVKRKQLVRELRRELMYLWGDLASAYRCSGVTPPERSPGCEGMIERIHNVTRVVGPVDPQQVEIWFLLTGMYERVHAAMDLEVVVPEKTMEACRRAEARNAEMLRKLGVIS
jgi:hypothetical protein